MENGAYQIDVAPVLQEIFGGPEDGKRVWAAFEFHLSGLSTEPGIEFHEYGAASRSPFVGISGEYFGQQFVLRIHQEPIADSEIVEVVDTVRNEVRTVEATSDE